MLKTTLGVIAATTLAIAMALSLNTVIIKQAFAPAGGSPNATGGFQSTGQGALSSDFSSTEHGVLGAIAKFKAHASSDFSSAEESALGRDGSCTPHAELSADCR